MAVKNVPGKLPVKKASIERNVNVLIQAVNIYTGIELLLKSSHEHVDKCKHMRMIMLAQVGKK